MDQSAKKLILRNRLSPGDGVMLTAAVRDLHANHPGRFRTDVRTFCPEIWDYNPHLTPLEESDPEVEIIDTEYPLIRDSNRLPNHFIHGFMDFLSGRLGVPIQPTLFKGDIHLSPLEKSWWSQARELAGRDIPFWVIVAGGKFDMTIKWWAHVRYQQVVDRFRGRIQFVQIGGHGHHHPKLDGVIDLRGKTDLRQLIRLIYHAQGVLGGVTAAMHLAAAIETKPGRSRTRPCVVVAGGREPVQWEAYPHHQFIHTIGQLPCCAGGGCWRARTRPLGDGDERDQPEKVCVDVVGDLPRCMDMISAGKVIRRIEDYFDGGVVKYLTPEESRAGEQAVRATAGNKFESLDAPPGRPVTSRRTRPARHGSILIQQGSGAYAQMLDLTHSIHAAYCEEHRFSLWSVRGGVQHERPAHWDKIVLIRQALSANAEFVIWLDADTLVVNPAVDLREALPVDAVIGMCRHPCPFNGQSGHYNSGVIVVRNTDEAHQFFARVWELGPVDHVWQEQVRINEVAARAPAWIAAIDDRWNSTHGVNESPAPVVKAWHGLRGEAVEMIASEIELMKESPPGVRRTRDRNGHSNLRHSSRMEA